MAKCNTLHAIINSNCLLSILKAHFIIKCYFLSILILIHTHTHTIYFDTQSLSHIIYVFLSLLFFFRLFFSLLSKKDKNKNFFFSLLVHTYGYISSNLSLPSLSLCLPHHSLLRCYTFFIIIHNLTLLLPILLVHAYSYTFSNIYLLSLPLYLPHYSLLRHYTSFIIFSFL